MSKMTDEAAEKRGADRYPKQRPPAAFSTPEALTDFRANLVCPHSALARARQTQNAFGDDVALDFGGPGLDRVGPRAQESILPAA